MVGQHGAHSNCEIRQAQELLVVVSGELLPPVQYCSEGDDGGARLVGCSCGSELVPQPGIPVPHAEHVVRWSAVSSVRNKVTILISGEMPTTSAHRSYRDSFRSPQSRAEVTHMKLVPT